MNHDEAEVAQFLRTQSPGFTASSGRGIGWRRWYGNVEALVEVAIVTSRALL